MILAIGAVACVLFCDKRVEDVAEGRHYDDVNNIPLRNVGLLSIMLFVLFIGRVLG